VRRALFSALAASLLLVGLVMPASAGGGSSISYAPAVPTTTTGVSFTVTTGGGNRDFASVQVVCVDLADPTTIVYGTTLTIQVAPKGTGTSQVIYPPVSSCTADLVKLNQIGSARVLATTSFEVTQ
jgi:hypothetical protein